MIKKGAFQGSIYELGSDQLRQLRTAALYRGLDGVAQAIIREQVRRSARTEQVTNKVLASG